MALKQIEINKKPVVIVMAKFPAAGQVKTRLQPFLTSELCAELSLCFLRDTLLKIQNLKVPLIVSFSPAESKEKFLKLVSETTILIEQLGEDLGERLQNAVCFASKRGFSPIIVIGTDSPTFPPDELVKAIEILEKNENECVFGPTQDGGYYLVGLAENSPVFFKNVEWSSANTLADNIRNAESIFAKTPSFVRQRHDVDEPSDLKLLFNEFASNQDLAVLSPHTADWLVKNKHLFE